MAGNPAGSRNVEVYEKVEQVVVGSARAPAPDTLASQRAGLHNAPP